MIRASISWIFCFDLPLLFPWCKLNIILHNIWKLFHKTSRSINAGFRFCWTYQVTDALNACPYPSWDLPIWLTWVLCIICLSYFANKLSFALPGKRRHLTPSWLGQCSLERISPSWGNFSQAWSVGSDFGLFCTQPFSSLNSIEIYTNSYKSESLILSSWVKHDKHNFTQIPYEPDWQISLGVRASG